MIMLLLPAAVNAETIASGTCGNELTWTLDSEGTLTINGSGNMTNYLSYSAIPWYTSRASIKKICISEGVTSVGSRAFYNCTQLESATLPTTLSEIGSYAFSGCTDFKDISLPDNLSQIGNRAFYNCQNITKLIIPDGIAVLKNSTFAKCSSLSEIKLGNGVYELEDSVFEACGALSEILLGENIEFFGEDIFASCSENLTLIAYHNTPAAEYCLVQPYNYVIKCVASFYSDSELLFKNEYLLGSNLIFPENTVVKEGYDFAGWEVDGVKFYPGEGVAVEGNLNINAVWKMQTFNVMFETGTGINPEPLTKKYWEDLVLNVQSPQKEGYDFIGWSTTENSDIAEYMMNSNFTVNANTVLYAVWQEKTYTVTYDIPEAENTIENQVKRYTERLQLSDTLPVRNGYTFLGWSRKQEAVLPEFQPGELFDINENTVLYAVWTSGIIPGDADNNGIVDMADLIIMLKRINNYNIEFTQDNITAMDVYNDTYFNIKDVLKMVQYLAGWSNVVLGE